MDDNYYDGLAQDLEMGLICYVHRTTKEYISMPDFSEFSDNQELYQEDIDKIEANPDDYVEMRPMESRKSFLIMVDFAEQEVSNRFWQSKLIDALERSKPFRRFKDIVDTYDALREQWFAYKHTRYTEWVKEKLEWALSEDNREA